VKTKRLNFYINDNYVIQNIYLLYLKYTRFQGHCKRLPHSNKNKKTTTAMPLWYIF